MKNKIVSILVLSIFSLVFVTGCSLTNAIENIKNDEVTLTNSAKEVDEMVNEPVDPVESIEDLASEIDDAVNSLK